MIESVAAFLGQYGLFGLLSGSFLTSTIFLPMTIEPLIVALIPFHGMTAIVLVASLGSTAGTCINYGLGFLATDAAVRRVGKGNIAKTRQMMNRYGWTGLLALMAIPIPGVPVDPITIFPGVARMKFREFLITVFAGKIIKYSLFALFFREILNMLF